MEVPNRMIAYMPGGQQPPQRKKKRPPPCRKQDGERREDHSPERICAALFRQTTRLCRMVADGTGEKAVPVGKWTDAQFDAFLLLPPEMRKAYFWRGNFAIRTANGQEHPCITWGWADDSGEWLTIVGRRGYIDIRPRDVVSAAVIWR